MDDEVVPELLTHPTKDQAMPTATKTLIITDVELAYDGEECGYRIVELDDGQHAFIWGNIRSHVGDTLPNDAIESPEGKRGITLHDGFGDAVMAWNDCADALSDSGCMRAGGEMRLLAAIFPTTA
jgi:hypothetical protein